MVHEHGYFRSSQNKHILKEEKFPYLHPNISLSHLYENGKLLTDEEIKNTLAFFDNNPELYRVKTGTQNGNFYNILKFHHPRENKNHYYAIYFGEKHNKQLGKGAYGKVKLIQNLETSEWFALKIQKESTAQIPDDEYDILHHLNQTIGLTKRSVGSKTHQLLGMQLLRGMNLDAFSRTNPILPISHWIQMMMNIYNAIHHFHLKKLLHNDIKPGNIMIHPVTYEISLLDFQFSLFGHEVTKETACGTPGYMALELRLSDNRYKYNEKTEVHALGITFAELLGDIFASRKLGNMIMPDAQRYRVFCPENKLELQYRLSDPDTPPISIFNRIPDHVLCANIIQFLLQMTHDNPEHRPNMENVFEFLQSLQKKLSADPNHIKKIGILNIEEYMDHSEQERKALRLILKTMDEVWFIDTIERNQIDYFFLYRELEASHIKLGDKIFYPNYLWVSIPHMLKQIALQSQQKSSDFAYRQNYIFVSRNLTADLEESFEITDNHNPMLFDLSPDTAINTFVKPQA
ncbi:MAG: hypothetical protein A3F42_08495 [Gammaproteobacteria bacterium RIFCSPHIGHO2_12_FULL_37_34]|nr:MAG: hypothetical protein A3F42_08495 [Gammaproteobacteria bacterium RIFCSPHIGHO2_12_FULL_37_34]